MQRERERERERFETDRGRDHGRRTIERSQSPSHIANRRPASPAASPSLSERIPSDSDRRICCRSSDRSGSCSSVSPPRFEKLEKSRSERYNKTDKLEKDRIFEVERSTLVEKEKRVGRKDRGDKDKSEKQRLKKLKVASPIQACETEPETERDVSPESVIRSKNSKVSKESLSKGRLDLLPCVVQLTRVKEKEGKLIGQAILEKQIQRGGSDSPRLSSPSADQRSPLFRPEPSKGDMSKHVKVPRDKTMHSLVEVIDKDSKIKSKKHGKSEMGFDSGISIDIDRLAARKRRFEDSGKTDRQKRTSEEDLGRLGGLHKPWNNTKETDSDKNPLIKGINKKEHHKDKGVRVVSVNSPQDGRGTEMNTVSFSLERQSRLEEVAEDSTEPLDSAYLKMDLECSKCENSSSLTKTSDDSSLDLDEQQKQVLSENEPGRVKCSDSIVGDDHLVHIDQANICAKQIEQNPWLRPKLGDPDKLVTFENSPSNEISDFEKDYIMHDVGKPIQDMANDDFSSCKRKKLENFDFEIVTAKRERSFASSQKLNEDIYQTITSSGTSHFSANNEDETAQISVSVINKERKSSPATDDKFSHTESMKNNLGLTARHFQSSDTELPKLKTALLGCDAELMQRWERRIKSDSLRMEMTFPVAKRECIRKRLGQDLEPGEVQSDSDSDDEDEDDDDDEDKPVSPKSNSSLSYILREHDERMIDLRHSGSLEKNKFYSFALDKTITPDTKALLERAKTLYSSREDNWSFLPSRFPTSHSCSDKRKVELAPRPIPSWYMKKKKIRTDSEEKLHDKKEELKPQDQERQELFASRFLHSSIFEQDSRRLQHLERKDQDLETGIGRPFAKTSATDGQPDSGAGEIPQEPIVLFHSRFLELQQKKDKDHPPPDTENDLVVTEIERDEVQNSDNVLSEQLLKVDGKSASSPLALSVSQFVVSPKEMSPEKKEVFDPSMDQLVSFVKEVKVEPVVEMSPSHSLPVDDLKPVVPKLTITPPSALSELENDMETQAEINEPKVKIGDGKLAVEHNPPVEDKPPTPGGSPSGFERDTAELSYSDYAKIQEKSEIINTEPKIESEEPKHFDDSQKNEIDSEAFIPELEVEIKPLPNRRQPKSKRAKPLSVLRTSQPSQNVATEKPATRKSERIDREKLKRASSPRAEAPKTSFESKIASKSPSHASDSEQNLESSLIHGRTRRRNVRSVYATLHEDDQASKEVAESSRSMRKRGADKESIQQDVQVPTTNTRRGRPPKRCVKRGEDVSPVKGDQQKIIEEDIEFKETSSTVETVKASEGWRSPRNQKVQQTQLTLSIPGNKKGSRLDKQPGSTTALAEKIDLASQDESELKPKADSELFGKLSERAENSSSPVHRKEKDLKDAGGKKSADSEGMDTNSSEKTQQPEKSVKMKTPRLKRNTRQIAEEKSHSLKNLEIRVSVDDVKGLLRSEDHEPESVEAPINTKTKEIVQENTETNVVCPPKESQDLANEKEDTLSEPELPVDPAAALLARQMELEQAVENIAKLTVEHPLRPYKEPPSEQPAILPPVIVEPEGEVEEEKRANPASETELAAAIDSITAEETCADTDGFTATPTYSALIPTTEPMISPSSNEIMEPETHMVINNILASDSDDGPLTSSPKGPVAESKAAEDTRLLETPKKTSKVRAKTPKKSRSRKGTANKKGDTSEEVSQPEPSPVKLPESIPEDPETINLKAVTVTAGATAAASVVTAVATCRRDVTSAITVDTPKEAEQPEVEQPVPKESAFHSGTSNISSCKKNPQLVEQSSPTLASSPARPQAVSQFSLLRPAKMSPSPDWPHRSEESRIYVAPSCHVTVVTTSVTASTALGNPSANPTMPPDTKASDIDPSSSTLRKILMEPKYVSASNSNSIPNTMVTSALSDPSRMSENENPCHIVSSRQLHPEDRPPLPPQPIHHKPSPLTESQQNCGEKTQHTVISPPTSVISRIPMPYDTEETPRISLSNRSMGLTITKQKFRSNTNENNRYHGMDMVEDGTRAHSVVEATTYSTGSSPGLRVNTSEGVVVLSYSGQKTEGPHRMRAKISQIPQASAGDIEFQQSVSKSQIKQDPLMASSHSPTSKIGPTPTPYGHTGVLLTGQSYNSQPVISSTKQESLVCDKSEAPYHTTVKMFQQPVSSPQVLIYNPAVIQQQHGKREPLPKKKDIAKAVQHSNLSPVMSPHHPSLSGTRMSPSPGIPTDRSALHLKQEPQSPRTAVPSPSPFIKACPPSNSPKGTSVVLGQGLASVSAYHSTMHHPHSEQSSVIMQPHSVTQSVAHESRINTPPMSGINYGRRGDSLSSSHPGPPQRSNTPQSNVIRDMVLQSHSSPQSVSSGSGSSVSEEDPRHFNQALSRPSGPQLQSDVMMIHGDHRVLHPSIRMDQYRDMHQRMLMHQKLGEQSVVEARQARTSEIGTSSSNISGPSKSPIAVKGIELSTKESLKPLEGKLIHPPASESRIRGVHTSSSVMLSPHSHGVQLMHPGGTGSFPVFRDMRGFSSQFPGHPTSGHSLANQGIASSQVI